MVSCARAVHPVLQAKEAGIHVPSQNEWRQFSEAVMVSELLHVGAVTECGAVF